MDTGGWDSMGLERVGAGPGGDVGRAFRLGPVRKDRICFFPEFIFNAKTISKNLEIVLKERKILGKFQKF
jgi:hypothetical protein